MRSLVAFLTVLPVGMNRDYLKDAAQLMYLFPLVGAFIGLLAGLVARLLETLVPRPLVGLLSLALVLLITGLHHTDGLLDLGDGLMKVGTPEEKIEAMHDLNTGTGGFVLGLVIILTTAGSIAALSPVITVQALIVSETCAKFAMTLEARIGRSAHRGMNTWFVESMHGRWGDLRLAVALAVSVAISFLLPFPSGLISLAAVVTVVFAVIGISDRHFKGITGDVLGATNDLARMFSLLLLVAAR